MNKTLKRGATVVASTMALGVGGIGYAFWTATGTGTATQGTIDTTAITVVQDALSKTAALYPGGSTTIFGTFSNPNAADVRVNTVTAALLPYDGTTTPVTGLPVGCVATDFTFTKFTTTDVLSIPGGTPSNPGKGGTWSLTMTMKPSDLIQDACKTKTIPLTLSSSYTIPTSAP